MRLVVAVALAPALLGALAFASYPGALLPYLAFNAAQIAMLLLAVPRPRVFAYTILALFLFLGFWGKLWVHFGLGFLFIEPTGAFDGSGPAWDRALWLAAAGSAGLALPRALQLLHHRRRGVLELAATAAELPRWYVRHRRAVWIALVTAIAALNLWNVEAAFYQIGVNPRLVLPLRLNVGFAWLLNTGFALLVATLVHWELRLRSRTAPWALLAPLAEALAGSMSMLSRSAFVLHVGPYVLAALERRVGLASLTRAARVMIALALFATFGASIVLVQALRASVYFAPGVAAAAPAAAAKSSAPSPAPAGESYFVQMMRQLPFLMVHRWVGLEGVMAVSSHPELGAALARQAFLEDPRKGQNSLYQRIARSFYTGSERFTFLTLPGAIAVLAYSGSALIVALGAVLLGLLVIGTELAVARGIGNPLVMAVAGAAIANVVSNLTYPYLAAIFFAELWVTLAAIWLLHAGSHSRPPARDMYSSSVEVR
jgi:hypothetical protein